MVELWEMWLLTNFLLHQLHFMPLPTCSLSFSLFASPANLLCPSPSGVCLFGCFCSTALLLWITGPPPGEVLHSPQHQIKPSQKPSRHSSSSSLSSRELHLLSYPHCRLFILPGQRLPLDGLFGCIWVCFAFWNRESLQSRDSVFIIFAPRSQLQCPAYSKCL